MTFQKYNASNFTFIWKFLIQINVSGGKNYTTVRITRIIISESFARIKIDCFEDDMKLTCRNLNCTTIFCTFRTQVRVRKVTAPWFIPLILVIILSWLLLITIIPTEYDGKADRLSCFYCQCYERRSNKPVFITICGSYWMKSSPMGKRHEKVFDLVTISWLAKCPFLVLTRVCVCKYWL